MFADYRLRVPADFLAEEKFTLGDEQYRQEYCCEFISAEGALFDEDQIRSKLSSHVPPMW